MASGSGVTETSIAYKLLFVKGATSDITVTILDKEWKLHRRILPQSPYFKRLLESLPADQEAVTIEMSDEHVTNAGLMVALGALYQPEYFPLTTDNVCDVLSASIWLEMTSQTDKCINFMEVSSASYKNAVRYYRIAEAYEDRLNSSLLKSTFDWVSNNLILCFSNYPEYLRQISPDMMMRLLDSPTLMISNYEIATFFLLKVWVYVRENPLWLGNIENTFLATNSYFSNSYTNDKPFLESATQDYIDVFKKLRLEHMVTHPSDITVLEQSCIFPRNWINSAMFKNFDRFLKVQQGLEGGPTTVMSEEKFYTTCNRLGTILKTNIYYEFYWDSFDFGFNLAVMYEYSKILSIVRRRCASNKACIKSLNEYRSILFQATIAKIDTQKQVTVIKSTPIKLLHFRLGDKKEIFTLDPKLFPVLLNVKVLALSPEVDDQ